MAFNIDIVGAMFVVTDFPKTQEYIKNPLSKTTFSFDDVNDVFQFFDIVDNVRGVPNQTALGGQTGTWDFADLNAITENGVIVPRTTAEDLNTYLSSQLSVNVTNAFVTLLNEIVPKENTSTYKQLAQIQPAVSNTAELLYSPGVDEEVHITTVSVVNLTNQDVTVVFYIDDDGTTWDDTTTVANPVVAKAGFAKSVWGEAVVYMNNSAGSLAVESSSTDVTITVWGIIYDLS